MSAQTLSVIERFGSTQDGMSGFSWRRS